MGKKTLKIIKRILLGFLTLIIIFIIYFFLAIRITPPAIPVSEKADYERIKLDDDFYVAGKSWLKKNKSGLWELFIEGSTPYELGMLNGILTQELIYKQEKEFINEIHKFVPSNTYLYFLKYFVLYFNRNLPDHIPEDYQLEIFGVSNYASDEFDFIGPKYYRILNYHGAHDIGHALQNMNLVECTAFAVWDRKSYNENMIIGRNFDFNVGDEFAENKIVCFIKPDKGHNFMMLTWGGMIGAVSGMNEKGLTVTLNSAKSDIPFSAKTPVSIIAREILQYASNIKEAYEIAAKHESFVSESFLIGSLEDNRAVVIEKSTKLTSLYSVDSDYIILTNHFQSEALKNQKLNIENMNSGSSVYRYNRVEELLDKYDKIDEKITAGILRDQKGLGNADIGMGNEKAINQLVAHHSIIFEPAESLVWISVGPFQLGEYVCYNLKKVFRDFPGLCENLDITEKNRNIIADTAFLNNDYEKFLCYVKLRDSIKSVIFSDREIYLDQSLLDKFEKSNPEYFYVYSLLGDYYKKTNNFEKAQNYYLSALEKEIPTLAEKKKIEENLSNK